MDVLIPTSLIENFQFLRPLWLLALVPAILLIAALWRLNSSVTAWDRAIDHELLPFLLDRSKNASQRTPLVLLLVVWTLSSLALAGPVWEKLPQPVQKREDALVIVLDLSLSMFAPDHNPSRVDLAKRKLRDVLALRDEGQTALVVYAGDAHTVTPLTDDVVTIEALVPSLNPNIMPLFGSDPIAALSLAIELLKNTDGASGKILLMTDGIAGFDEEQRIADLLEGTGNELLVMGIGTEEGAPIRTNDGNLLTDERGTIIVPKLNRNLLTSLANRVGGRYHDIQLADSDLAYLLSEINPLDNEALSDVEEEFDVWYEAGPWLLLLVLPLAAFSFRRGWLFVIPLTLAFSLGAPSQRLYAADFGPTVDIQINEEGNPMTLGAEEAPGFSLSEAWKGLWKTPNQRGADALNAGEPGIASTLFEDSDWRGAAAYRGENYEAAVAAFAANPSADGHYNRGNALAQSGNYAEAITAYEIAIGLDTSHEDAIKNKEIVEQLLQQQEAEQGEQEEGDSEDSDSQQNSESESDQQEESSEQQDQESQEGNQEQQEQEQQQQQAPEEQDSSESNSEQNTANETENEDFEEQQALEQWLRRIDDDPGELLRRKFRYQYRQRQLNGTANQTGGQIW
ncbi:MAG: VWA domain-containing protein [Gammaproteobacteria bacterium]|jgi:Ca-activated chloride channel family protein|nr:VWA domain-containing protein [Gammaproteobacteria bacterium]